VTYAPSTLLDRLVVLKYAPIYLLSHYFDYVVGSAFLNLGTIAGFQVAYKIHILVADWAMALVIFRAVKGFRGVLAPMLLLFNPFFFLYSVNVSQGHTVMAAFLLAGSFLILRGRFGLGSLFLGLAVMTLQYALYAVIPVLILILTRQGVRRFLLSLACTAATMIVVSLPFVVFGSLSVYLQFVFLQYLEPRQYFLAAIGNTIPNRAYLQYISTFTLSKTGLISPVSFNGLWSVLGYLNGLEVRLYWSFLLIAGANLVLLFVVAYSIVKGRVINAVAVALLGMAVFELVGSGAGSYYVIVYIPLAVLAGALTAGRRMLFAPAILGPTLYNVAEYLSQILGVGQPLYIGDVFTSLALLGLIGVAATKGLDSRVSATKDGPSPTESFDGQEKNA
jgi:hypothetical protein